MRKLDLLLTEQPLQLGDLPLIALDPLAEVGLT
jgi:hypothetical protein